MKTKSGVVLMLLALASGANAVGFKNISVASYLNEPLDARIPLVSITAADAEQLKVELAGDAAFEKAGLIRPLQLSALRFEIKRTESGSPFIHVTTQDGVREPFLNFLMEVTFQGNRLQREFTVLLDPRTTPFQPARVAPAPVTAEPAPSRQTAAPKAGGTPRQMRTYGPVKRSETLWVIAKRVRPDRSVSVEQMMMALLDANPHAFTHGNVNLLKQGSVLTIPDMQTVEKLTAREARQKFAQQNSDWQVLKSGGEPESARVVAANTPQPAAADAAASGSVEGDGVATVMPPASDEQPLSVDQGATLRVVEASADVEPQSLVEPEAPPQSATDAQLRAEISDSKRDLETVREINRDLVELKDALELKIETLRQALEARNRTIDRLEQRLNETLTAAAGDDGKVNSARAPLGGERKVPAGVRSEIEMGRTDSGKPKAQSQPPKVVGNERGLQDELLDLARMYWMELAAAGVLLLLLLVVILIRRRGTDSAMPDSEAFGSYIDDDDQPVTQESPFVVKEAARTTQPAERESEESKGNFAHGDQTDVASALTEADIYLAYRRYGQAESLIQQAIDQNPENMILKAKLLEIYAFRKDKARFVAAMEDAYQPMTTRAPEIWAKIVDMAREIAPDHELIDGQMAADSGKDALADDFSLDLDVAKGLNGDGDDGGAAGGGRRM